MAGYDIAVTREALRQGADRYAEVTQDQEAFFREAEAGHAIPYDGGREAPAVVIMNRRDLIMESLDMLNGWAHETLQRLSNSLDDSWREYSRTEEQNEELIRRTAAAWTDGYGKPGESPKHVFWEVWYPRTDWSQGSAAQSGGLGGPLQTDWHDLERRLAIANLDPGYWKKIGFGVGSLIEDFLGWAQACQTVDQVKAEFTPVYQLGQVIQRSGDGYTAVAADLLHDMDVLASNWSGEAGEAADLVFNKLSSWFGEVGGNAHDLGHALQERAEACIMMQAESLTIITDIVSMLPELPNPLDLFGDGMEVLEFLIMGGDPWMIVGAIMDTLMVIAGELCKLAGIILMLWHIALGVVELISFGAAAGKKGLAITPPVWNR